MREKYRAAVAAHYAASQQGAVQGLFDDDARLESYLRDIVGGVWHPCGTCRMGAADAPTSVVDPECRVIGVSGLRVIDASVMPTVVRANTHFTTVMIAEKMADLLKRGA